MRRTTVTFALWAVFLVRAGGAGAQEVPRDEYLKQLPLGTPRLVGRTAASEALHLFGDRGDPSYRDTDPADGIDDGRQRVLMSLAVRFAPYLVENTKHIPTNFDVYVDNRDSFPLVVDTWEVSDVSPRRLGSKGVNFSVLGRAGCDAPDPGPAWDEHPQPTADGAVEDCKLRGLVERYVPGGGALQPRDATLVRGRPELLDVLFFDFPGEDPKSWQEAYQPEYERTPVAKRASFPHAYVHPFLSAVLGERGATLGYELVLQYWFFYPNNDSGMNHEGDWEHLNVVVSPRSMVGGPLSAATVTAILSGTLPAMDAAPDPLVIRRLDYYFHHFVMTLDFSSPNVYQARERWQADVETHPRTRFQESDIWKAIRHMAYVDDREAVVNTHPLGYIGADSKGLNQALSAPGSRDRDPHGTYPFPGRYQNVGPGQTTDQVSVYVDPRRYWKDLAANRASAGPDFERGHVLGLADTSRLRIVPDWERVTDLVRSGPRARREWAWLVLPARWGYPATVSPFSGVLENFDTGNVAPVGPSFSTGWNVSGPAPGFAAYDPHMIPSLFPLAIGDNFRNDLGCLNLTVPLLLNLPPLDFVARIGTYPLRLALNRRDPVYYPKKEVPFRFVGLSSGASLQSFSSDFKAMIFNPVQYDEFIVQFLLHYALNGGDSTTTVVGGSEFVDHYAGPFYKVAFYIGGHVASENVVRNARPKLGFTADFSNIPSYRYSAELDYWEYSGSLRYSISTSRFQPYLKGGYGWSWYQLENVQANGVPFTTGESGWIKPQNIWPNVWHYGVGAEYVPWKREGPLPGGAELALSVEYERYTETLGLDLSGVPLTKLGLLFDKLSDVPVAAGVHRDVWTLGLTVSF